MSGVLTTWTRTVVARRRVREQDGLQEGHQCPGRPQLRHQLPLTLPALQLEM